MWLESLIPDYFSPTLRNLINFLLAGGINPPISIGIRTYLLDYFSEQISNLESYMERDLSI